MATSSSWKEADNCFRSSKLLVEGGKYLAMELLLQECVTKGGFKDVDDLLANTNNHAKINNLKPRVIKDSQYDILYPPSKHATSITEWDITLTTFVLKNCGTLNKLQNDAVKDIRTLRNKLYGHNTRMAMSETEFQNVWTDIVSTLKNVSSLLSKDCQQKFEDMHLLIEKETLSADKAIDTLKTWHDWENRIETILTEMNDTITEIKQSVRSIQDTESRQQKQTLSRSCKRNSTYQKRPRYICKKIPGSSTIHGHRRGDMDMHGMSGDINIGTIHGYRRDDFEMYKETIDRITLNRKIEQAKIVLNKHGEDLKKAKIAYKTKLTEVVTDKLLANNIVVLKGIPGIGKTHVARNAMIHILSCRKQIQPLIVNDAKDIEAVLDPHDSFVLLIDDILGDTSLDEIALHKWNTYAETFLAQVLSRKSFVIITSRTSVIENCKRTKTHQLLLNVKNIVDLGKYLDATEMNAILNIYLGAHNISLPKSITDDLISKQYYGVGFPLLCRMITSDLDIKRFFSSPHNAIKDMVLQLPKHDCASFIALIITLFAKGQLKQMQSMEQLHLGFGEVLVHFKSSKVDKELVFRAAHALVGTYLCYDKNELMFSFLHETITSAVFKAALERIPNILIKYCPLEYVVGYIRPPEQTFELFNKEDSVEIGILPNKVFYDRILERFAESFLISSQLINIQTIAKSTLWQDDVFVGKALQTIQIIDIFRNDDNDKSLFCYFSGLGYTKLLKAIMYHSSFSTYVTEPVKQEQINKAVLESIKSAQVNCVVVLVENEQFRITENMLFEAASQEEPSILELLTNIFGTKKLLDLSSPDKGKSLLHVASQNRRIKNVHYLCEVSTPMIQKKDRELWNAAHYAANHGSVDVLNYLLSEGVDPYEKTRSGKTMLHLTFDINVAKYICEQYKDLLKMKDKNGVNAAHEAAKNCSIECLQYLIKQGLNPHDKTDTDETLLHCASLGGNIEVVKYLCETYTDMLYMKNNCNRNVAHNAAQSCNVECLQYLIKQGLNPHDKTDTDETLLHCASLGGNIEVVKYLNETYTDMLYMKDNCNRNAAHYAAQRGNVECLKYLIKQGINPYDKTNNDETLLHRASLGGNIEVVKYLCETYTDMLYMKDNCNRNVAHNAAQSCNVECLQYLIKQGINPYDKTNNDETLLHRASLAGNMEVVKYLNETYTDMLYMKDNCNRNVAHNAAQSGNVECLQYLIKQGLNPHDKTDTDETLLHCASLGGNIEVVKYLNETYTDMLYMKDNCNRNAAHYAAQRGNVECLKYLIKQGVNPYDKTNNDETLLHRASLGGNIEVVKYLCETYTDMLYMKDNCNRNVAQNAAQSCNVECLQYLIKQGINPYDKTNNDETLLHHASLAGNMGVVKYLCETYTDMLYMKDNCNRNVAYYATIRGNVECLQYLIKQGINPYDKTNNDETLLHSASLGGNIEVVKYLCEIYTDMLYMKGYCNRNVAHCATESGDVECLQYLIKQGINPYDKTNDNETLLHRASLAGNIEVVKYLCETYTDMLYMKDNCNGNAAHFAAQRGNVECLQYLIKQGINPYDKINNDETLLHRASLGGNIEVVKYLCETYTDMLYMKYDCNRNAAHYAAQRGNVECLQYLIKQGINPYDKTNNDETLLHLASLGENIEVVKYLCETYPDMLYMKDNCNGIAAHNAAQRDNVECLQYLIKQGINPYDKTNNDETLLHHASLGENIEVVKYLCETYTDMLYMKDNCNRNAAHFAAQWGNVECLQYLIKQRINPYDKTNNNETLLHRASLAGNIEVVKYLCETYTDMLYMKDNCNRNAAHYAAQWGNVECLQYLIKQRINPYDKTNNNETLLHRASLGENIEVVKYLCETYPDMLYIKGNCNRNVAHYAAQSGNVECLQYLIKQGIDPNDKTDLNETLLHMAALGQNIKVMKYLCKTYTDMSNW